MKKNLFTVFAVLLSTAAWASHHDDDQVLIQSGAFKNQVFAEQQAAKVSLLGVPSGVVEIQDVEGNIVRVVRSKQSMPQKEAEVVIDRLEQNNVRAMLIDNF